MKGVTDVETSSMRLRAVPYFEADWKNEDIARLFKRSVRTIIKWRAHPDVRAAMGQVRENVLLETQLEVTELVKRAFATVYELMASGEARVRLEAAKTILDRFGYPVETKSETRTEATGEPRVVVKLTQQQAIQLAQGGD